MISIIAAFNERLLLGSGMSVSPLRNDANSSSPGIKSLREAARHVDNERDFKEYILSHLSKANSGSSTIRYERHPVRRILSTEKSRTNVSRLLSDPAVIPKDIRLVLIWLLRQHLRLQHKCLRR